MLNKLKILTQKLKLRAPCVLCNQYHAEKDAVCEACYPFLSSTTPACQYCAHPLNDTTFLVCGQCCQHKPILDFAWAPYRFEEPIRTLLHAFKYHEALYLSSFLANLILRKLPAKALETECLIPVPLHPKRLRQRGFNQAVEIAKQLSKKTTLPIDIRHCEKIRHTLPQAHLPAVERQRNLKGAFRVSSLPFQHVTIVDDLLTTGSTINELATVLKRQGVKRVDAWCCAKTVVC